MVIKGWSKKQVSRSSAKSASKETVKAAETTTSADRHKKLTVANLIIEFK